MQLMGIHWEIKYRTIGLASGWPQHECKSEGSKYDGYERYYSVRCGMDAKCGMLVGEPKVNVDSSLQSDEAVHIFMYEVPGAHLSWLIWRSNPESNMDMVFFSQRKRFEAHLQKVEEASLCIRKKRQCHR